MGGAHTGQDLEVRVKQQRLAERKKRGRRKNMQTHTHTLSPSPLVLSKSDEEGRDGGRGGETAGKRKGSEGRLHHQKACLFHWRLPCPRPCKQETRRRPDDECERRERKRRVRKKRVECAFHHLSTSPGKLGRVRFGEEEET